MTTQDRRASVWLASRIALRAVTVFLIFVGIVGGVGGIIIGIGSLIFLIDKHFHWGEAGIAIMTLLVVFAAVSVVIAVTDEYSIEDRKRRKEEGE